MLRTGGYKMSRIGRLPIDIGAGVDIKIDDKNNIVVKGPNGTLTKQLHSDMIIKISRKLTVNRLKARCINLT